MCIKSILDTDFYKLTTSYAYMKLFPEAEGTFTFCDRDNTEYDEDFLERLKLELANLSMVRMTKEELNWSKNIRFIPDFYFEWLNQFRFDFNKIQLRLDDAHHLHINVTDKLYKVTLWETMILCIVSEVYNQNKDLDLNQVYNNLYQKIRKE